VLLPDNHQMRNHTLHGDSTVDEKGMPQAVTARCRRNSHHAGLMGDTVQYQRYTKEKDYCERAGRNIGVLGINILQTVTVWGN
jgi:hypothetical protein